MSSFTGDISSLAGCEDGDDWLYDPVNPLEVYGVECVQGAIIDDVISDEIALQTDQNLDAFWILQPEAFEFGDSCGPPADAPDDPIPFNDVDVDAYDYTDANALDFQIEDFVADINVIFPADVDADSEIYPDLTAIDFQIEDLIDVIFYADFDFDVDPIDANATDYQLEDFLDDSIATPNAELSEDVYLDVTVADYQIEDLLDDSIASMQAIDLDDDIVIDLTLADYQIEDLIADDIYSAIDIEASSEFVDVTVSDYQQEEIPDDVIQNYSIDLDDDQFIDATATDFQYDVDELQYGDVEIDLDAYVDVGHTDFAIEDFVDDIFWAVDVDFDVVSDDTSAVDYQIEDSSDDTPAYADYDIDVDLYVDATFFDVQIEDFVLIDDTQYANFDIYDEIYVDTTVIDFQSDDAQPTFRFIVNGSGLPFGGRKPHRRFRLVIDDETCIEAENVTASMTIKSIMRDVKRQAKSQDIPWDKDIEAKIKQAVKRHKLKHCALMLLLFTE